MKNDVLNLKTHMAAVNEWRAAAAKAEQLGYAAHARDLAPMRDATTRSIKVRTGKLRRFLAAVAQ